MTTRKLFVNSKLYNSFATKGTSIISNKHTSKFVAVHHFGNNLTKCGKKGRNNGTHYESTTSKLAN